MSAAIIRADARRLPLPDGSVDLIVTSPPYWGLRSYTDGGERYDGQIGAEPTPTEYVAALLECTREWVRVLKPKGSLWVNLGDAYYSGKGAPGRNNVDAKSAARRIGVRPLDRSGLALPRKSLVGTPWRYALACIDDLALTLRAEVIWSKPNPLPESVSDRVGRTHEHLFHLTKQDCYYADLSEIREPHNAPKRIPGANAFGGRNINLPRSRTGVYEGPATEGKLPGSVWEVATRPFKTPPHLEVEHYALMPPALATRVVLGWSPAGGLVLDPFGGTGTTALVASVHGRHGISADLSHDYGRLARWRTTDPGERARALGVPKPPPVPDGQDSLFEEIA